MRHLRLGRRVALLVPLALLFGVVFTTGSSAASAPVSKPATFTSDAVTFTSTYSYFPALSTVVVGSTTPIAVDEAVFKMGPREIRRVTDQLEFRATDTGNDTEVDNTLECFDQYGHEIFPSPPPPSPVPDDGKGGNGTNYITDNDFPYQWNASMLVQAPPQNPEEYYVCLLEARIDPGHRMTVLAPTTGETTHGTWLAVSTANEVGAQQLHTPSCASSVEEGEYRCLYVGGPARLDNPTVEYVPWEPWNAPGRTAPEVAWYWTAGDDATTIDGVATLQITECDWETPSCPPDERGDSGVTRAVGESYLDIDQLYPNGSVCQVNRAYSEETSPDGQVLLNEGFVSEGFAIPMEQHHLPLYYHLSAPVSQTCEGSRQFMVDLYIQWTGANGVKVDGGNVNVLNSVRETTTTVPDVTGLTQAQAGTAIQAAGLTVGGAPDHVTSTAPPGTVVGQNSPAGTIEPAGSPVQLTVSLGQATVPDVLGEQPAAAVQAIREAGLTAVTLAPINKCVSSGTTRLFRVQFQDPAGGAQVALGSQVDIRVAGCLR
jgi:PASTA domain